MWAPQFSPISCDALNVAISAFYRESEPAGARIKGYAGAGMGFPYVLRLVELDGVATSARLHFAGPLTAAYRTNLLGEIAEPLVPSSRAASGSSPIASS